MILAAVEAERNLRSAVEIARNKSLSCQMQLKMLLSMHISWLCIPCAGKAYFSRISSSKSLPA